MSHMRLAINALQRGRDESRPYARTISDIDFTQPRIIILLPLKS